MKRGGESKANDEELLLSDDFTKSKSYDTQPTAPPLAMDQEQLSQPPTLPRYSSSSGARENELPSYVQSLNAPSAPPMYSPDDLVRVGNGNQVTLVPRREIPYAAVACFNEENSISTTPTDIHAFNQPFVTEDVGCIHGFKRSPHLKCLILTLGIWVMIILRLIVAFNRAAFGYYSHVPSTFEEETFFFPTLFGIYLIYLIEACCSSTKGYVNNKMQDPNPHVAQVLDSPPQITFHIQCYHYETRTRTVRDSNGNTKTETYTERVNTHSASMVFHIQQWYDDSAPFFVPNYEICQLKFSKSFKFTDASFSRYKMEREVFIRENDRDVHYSFTEGRYIAGMKKKALTYHENADLPCSTSPTWFWIFTLLTLSWFIRTHLGSHTGEFKYHYSKVIVD
eukprot:m.8965 g.8965  ORF g.8965 m.8965 type:complete len:395 (-) comp3319_c0_seq1:261-1445(-)